MGPGPVGPVKPTLAIVPEPNISCKNIQFPADPKTPRPDEPAKFPDPSTTVKNNWYFCEVVVAGLSIIFAV